MAYANLSPDAINSFITSKGIANDPWAIHNYAQQYNVDPAALEAARGWGAGTVDQWRAANITPNGAHDWTTAQTDPQKAYALAQANGWSGTQADSAYGLAAGTAGGWAASQGLTGFGASPAAAGGGGSAAPAAPTVPTGAGTWIQPGLGAPTGGWPAGGQGANYGNDPRTSMPQQPGMPQPRMGGGYMGNQGLGGLGGYLFQNPSTMALGNEVTRGVNNNLLRNVLPAIRRTSMANGVSGGSGQEIAEGLAIGESMAGLAGSLAGLYGNQFNADRQYGLSSDALDFNIHQGNLATTRQGQLDTLNGIGQIGQANQQGIATANQAYNAPLTRWQQFAGTGATLGGLGGQQTQNLQGNGLLGALGGYQLGSKAWGG